jgi:hypothetical protein
VGYGVGYGLYLTGYGVGCSRSAPVVTSCNVRSI